MLQSGWMFISPGMAMTDLIQTRMTAAEFRTLPENADNPELIHGELIVSPTPRYAHQQTVGNIYLIINAINPGGIVILSPMDVYLDDENVVQPDVFWVSGPQSRCQLGTDGYWHGAPDLVVEILSPSTALRDKTVKFDLYQKHGVREYWLVDPEARYIEVWKLRDGQFVHSGVYGPGDQFTSDVLEQVVTGEAAFK
jgi:Uma2 family endonuclease